MTRPGAQPLFHLALPVTDLVATRAFYIQTLQCEAARESKRWLDVNFFGHQLTLHLVDHPTVDASNTVDGDAVPTRHFGVILTPHQWQTLVSQLRAAQCEFLLEPRTRFAGKPAEQSTLFVRDPSGNALEFKSFASMDQVFATD
ncbi:MAG: VOC family protein [Pseudomonadota bacterium]